MVTRNVDIWTDGWMEVWTDGQIDRLKDRRTDLVILIYSLNFVLGFNNSHHIKLVVFLTEDILSGDYLNDVPYYTYKHMDSTSTLQSIVIRH